MRIVLLSHQHSFIILVLADCLNIERFDLTRMCFANRQVRVFGYSNCYLYTGVTALDLAR